mgnify:FL=1
MNNTEKIAKVIATCFVEREVRKSEAWYEHGQDLGSPESVLEMIKFIVKKEQEIDAGAPMDTIIVNNDSGYEPGKNYLAELNGTPTKNGVFKIINRENWGRSFGAYDAAFKKYKDKYEYWIFSEDDMYFSKNGYARAYLEQLNKDDNVAFIASIGIGRPDIGRHRTPHAHGGGGCTHRKYMEETIPVAFRHVYDDGKLEALKYSGELAHFSKKGLNLEELTAEKISLYNKHTRLHCLAGEVPFTYSLIYLGYKIETAEDAKQWYEFYE